MVIHLLVLASLNLDGMLNMLALTFLFPRFVITLILTILTTNNYGRFLSHCLLQIVSFFVPCLHKKRKIWTNNICFIKRSMAWPSKMSYPLRTKLLEDKVAMKFLSRLYIYIYIYIYFWRVHTRGGRGIRTSDFRFIKRDSSRLSYFLGTYQEYINIYCSTQLYLKSLS